MEETACATAVKPHPSQLFLPFSEGAPSRYEIHASQAGTDLVALPVSSACLSTTVAPPPPPKRLDCLAAYLRRHFPGFVLQQRTQPAGTVQLSLYRIPDGAFYRINVASRFLEGDWLEELEGFLEYHGLRDKVPASVLAPILIDREGIHVPNPPTPQDDGSELLRSRLKKILGLKGKEPTGLLFAP
jgi:hypothetical protein